MQDTNTDELDASPAAVAGEAPECQGCGRRRRPEEPDYTPVQAALGQTLGWFSGDDGEFCGTCIGALMRGQIP